MSPREDIYAALFNLVREDPSIKFASRRLVHWSEVAPVDQPALFLTQKTESAKVVSRIPTVWALSVDLWLYARTEESSEDSPMSLINPVLDLIVAKLMPTTHDGEQTLGGLVERCRIDGSIETDEGVLGNQAVVVIPIIMLVPQ